MRGQEQSHDSGGSRPPADYGHTGAKLCQSRVPASPRSLPAGDSTLPSARLPSRTTNHCTVGPTRQPPAPPLCFWFLVKFLGHFKTPHTFEDENQTSRTQDSGLSSTVSSPPDASLTHHRHLHQAHRCRQSVIFIHLAPNCLVILTRNPALLHRP